MKSNVDTLIAFGCSHTQGDEAVSDYNINFNKSENIYYAYPYYLSKLLGCKNYYNYAICGSSNQQIASTFFEKINKHTSENTNANLIVVIGWSCYNRLKVSQFTKNSYSSIKYVINNLPIIKRLHLSRLFSKHTKNIDGETFTISKGIIRLITRIKYGLPINKETQQYRVINEDWYKTKFKPFFHDEFILGIDKHLFHTDAYRDTNIFIKMCVDSFLTQNKIPYIAFPTMLYNRDAKDNFLNQKNNIDPAITLPYNLSFTQYYGEKYGLSSGGIHMKYEAHKKFAEFLYNEIKQRDIFS